MRLFDYLRCCLWHGHSYGLLPEAAYACFREGKDVHAICSVCWKTKLVKGTKQETPNEHG